ncbi:MAG: hypothetical protein FWE40_05820 [Oscillospiraceae bacterium]|nr:hypothetical protein [Oscillospiraceae bacterium]
MKPNDIQQAFDDVTPNAAHKQHMLEQIMHARKESHMKKHVRILAPIAACLVLAVAVVAVVPQFTQVDQPPVTYPAPVLPPAQLPEGTQELQVELPTMLAGQAVTWEGANAHNLTTFDAPDGAGHVQVIVQPGDGGHEMPVDDEHVHIVVGTRDDDGPDGTVRMQVIVLPPEMGGTVTMQMHGTLEDGRHVQVATETWWQGETHELQEALAQLQTLPRGDLEVGATLFSMPVGCPETNTASIIRGYISSISEARQQWPAE